MAHFASDTLSKPKSFNFAEDVIDYWAKESPSLQAMHWISQKTDQQSLLTYSYFSRRSHRAAAMLQQLGAKKGDKLLILLPRIPAWYVVVFNHYVCFADMVHIRWEIVVAAIRCGVVVCPCTTLLVDKDIEYRVQVSKASILVCDTTAAAKFARVRDKCPSITTVIQVDGVPSPGFVSYPALMSQIPEDEVFPSARLELTDPCMIYFTSGTTGLPKMVLHNQISYPLGRLDLCT